VKSCEHGVALFALTTCALARVLRALGRGVAPVALVALLALRHGRILCAAQRRRYDARVDLNQLARRIVDQATGESASEPESAKARAGRQGGRKGGRARSERLTPEERSEIARKAARARWQAPT
jgi:hypothetical protein